MIFPQAIQSVSQMSVPEMLLIAIQSGIAVAAWRAGSMSGKINQTMEDLKTDVRRLVDGFERIAAVEARVDGIDGRVERLEGL